MAKLLTIKVSDELHQAIRLSTVVNNTSITEVVREALEAWVEKHPAPKVESSVSSGDKKKRKK